MVKKNSLKPKLKAADRRRKKRSSASNRPARGLPASQSLGEASGTTCKVDVVGLITEVILKHVDHRHHSGTDAFVLSTLSGIMRGSAPATPEAAHLAGNLQIIADRDDIPERRYREGVESVLSMSRQLEKTQTADAFLQYLTILSR